MKLDPCKAHELFLNFNIFEYRLNLFESAFENVYAGVSSKGAQGCNPLLKILNISGELSRP